MKTIDKKTDIGSIESFINMVREGISLWHRAGELLIKLVDDNPNIYSDIIQRNSGITFEMLLVFERIGRKQIYPPLLMDNSPGARRLLEMPYDVQERFSKEPVDVVVNGDMLAPSVEKRYVKELSASDAKIVFGTSRVRSVSEQVEYRQQHNPVGRKKKSDRAKEPTLGTWLIKVSPYGAVVLEASNATIGVVDIRAHDKDGVKQCLIRLIP